MGNKTSVERDSKRGVVKINNLTDRKLFLVFTSVQATIVRKATSNSINVGVQGRGNGGRAPGGGGGVNVGVSSSQDTSYHISVVYSAEMLNNRPLNKHSDSWDDGPGVMRYEGADKGSVFYLTLFVDGKLRLINKVFHGGNVISFQNDGIITMRPEMKFDGKNEHRTCGVWNQELPVELVDNIPATFRDLHPLQ